MWYISVSAWCLARVWGLILHSLCIAWRVCSSNWNGDECQPANPGSWWTKSLRPQAQRSGHGHQDRIWRTNEQSHRVCSPWSSRQLISYIYCSNPPIVATVISIALGHTHIIYEHDNFHIFIVLSSEHDAKTVGSLGFQQTQLTSPSWTYTHYNIVIILGSQCTVNIPSTYYNIVTLFIELCRCLYNWDITHFQFQVSWEKK